jgi:hypothetical protein
LPQPSALPHPSGANPQSKPRLAHVTGLQTHVPFSQTFEAPQAPQSICPPQPSSIFPHDVFRLAQLFGLQV